MKLPESGARSELLCNGVEYEYGSTREAIAISHIMTKREIEYIKGVLPIAEKAGEVANKLRSLIYPDMFYDDVSKSVEAKKYFDSIRQNEFFIKPLG